MELILSHNNLDFDGLASMLAAGRLHPGAVMAIAGKPAGQVREFLALHKDALPILDLKNIEWSEVTKVILVDTHSLVRSGMPANLLAESRPVIDIYDHHPASPEDIKGERELVEAVGANTTLMVELLQKHKLAISPFEATLFALGIYEDTGSLMFESTTARDAAALSFLLGAGANLKVVGEFIERSLSRQQKSLLNTLLTAAHHYLIKGTRLLITTASVSEYIGGLALLVHKIGEIENLDLIFAVVRMDDRVHIVARGKGANVAVNEILREFGGAGHAKAASATVKNGDPEMIVRQLLALLEERIAPETRAREIMSTAVRRLSVHSSMSEARDMLLRYGHTGLPVVDGDLVAGIISRRDVDKAMQHGLGHAPVRGYMSRQVVSTGPDTPLSEIQELMITHDIGRLPVLEQGRLIGIISRSDVLRTLHGQSVPVSHQILRQRSRVQGREVLRLMEGLPLEVRDLFRLVQVLSAEQGLKVYVVGGFVRDLLLGVPNLDVDLVVEGDGPGFAKALGGALGARVSFHPQFGTANLTKDRLNLDVVTARSEYYPSPASLPTVENSSLKQDLYRRDFTINAMAIALDGAEFGSLIDYYGGYRDLQQGEIRTLHNLSFVDDPTRILRALRFEQRCGFQMEAQTLHLLQNAIRDVELQRLSRDRLRNEFILVLQEEQAGKILARLAELKAWEQILPGVPGHELEHKTRQAGSACAFLTELGLWTGGDLWQIRLLALLQGMEAEKAEEALQKLNFERRLLLLAREFLQSEAVLKGFLSLEGELKKGSVHRVLGKVHREALAAVLTVPELNPWVKDYLTAWTKVRVLVTGKDLKQLNIPPGPLYAKLLASLWDARLEGKVNNEAEEIALIKTLIKEATDVQH